LAVEVIKHEPKVGMASLDLSFDLDERRRS
jgi:hypothetical protein